MSSEIITNAMTVDVEDYFHVAALSSSISPADWDSIAPRVEDNTRRLIDLFAERDVKATFFTLGWVAERFPSLVRDIAAAGHEVACHGFSHQLIYTQDRSVFADETVKAKKILEDCIGESVNGYRAASYSITKDSLWALETIADAGFTYDSSIVATRHDLYGVANARREPHRLILNSGSEIIEFPPATVRLLGKNVPIAGGGYFRIFPYWFSEWGMRRVNQVDHLPFSFYLHPWEIDPQQPRIDAGRKSTFRHYYNLDKVESRLKRLMSEFQFSTMAAVLRTTELKDVAISQLQTAA